MKGKGRTERGFSLLETLVAFAVATLFLSTALPATVSSLERLTDVERRSRALTVARSTLERHMVIARFEEGVFDGRQGGFAWRTSISRDQPALLTRHPVPVALRRIEVEVSAVDGGPLLKLTAYRLGELR